MLHAETLYAPVGPDSTERHRILLGESDDELRCLRSRALDGEGFHGVVVTIVDALGAASQAGLHLTDVIISVQDQNIQNVCDFGCFSEKYDLAVGVRTGAMRRFVFVRGSA